MVENQSGIAAENQRELTRRLIVLGLASVVLPTKLTRQLITLVEQSCEVSGLRGTTFLALEHCSLRSAVDCFSQHIRWCPRCFLDDRSQLLDPYLRLLWSFSAIANCPEHYASLQSRCPHCRKTQSSLARCGPIDQCQHCGQPLCSVVGSKDQCTSDEIIRHAVLAPLIKAISCSPELTYAADATSAFAHWLIDQPHAHHKAVARDEHGQPFIPYRYVNTGRPIPFSTCVRISARFKIGLDSYLGGSTLEWSQAVYPDESWDLPVLPVEFVPGSLFKPCELCSKIEALRMESVAQQALSLSQVATTLGITIHDIVCLAPMLAQEIHCADVKREIMRKYNQHISELIEHYQRLGRESSSNPRMRVTALLEREFQDLPPSMIKNIVNEALTNC